MQLNLIILSGILLFTLALTVFFQDADIKANIAPVSVIEDHHAELPAFTFTSLDNSTYHAHEFHDKIMLINFWASWCAPCIAEFPKLIELARLYPENLVLLAISSDDSEEDIVRFIESLGEKTEIDLDNVIISHDIDKKITQDLFQTYMLPETIIVNTNAEMVHKVIGADWELDEMKELILKHKGAGT
jgi:thiol-disulfide isomerase/thioredoxin